VRLMLWALARAGHEEPRAQAARHGYSFADLGRSAPACGCTVGILPAMKACVADTAAVRPRGRELLNLSTP
jgi:hypothetical protein